MRPLLPSDEQSATAAALANLLQLLLPCMTSPSALLSHVQLTAMNSLLIINALSTRCMRSTAAEATLVTL
jgi:hypothetical protein